MSRPNLPHAPVIPDDVSGRHAPIQPKFGASAPTRPAIQAKLRVGQPGPPPPLARPGSVGGATVQRKLEPLVQEFPWLGASATIQLKCTCKKSGNKHRSDCPANQNQKKRVAAVVKVKKQQNTSWMNMMRYQSNWVAANGITEGMVKTFIKQYPQKMIRGHHTGYPDKDQGRQGVTTTDLNAYKTWHTKKYNGWSG